MRNLRLSSFDNNFNKYLARFRVITNRLDFLDKNTLNTSFTEGLPPKLKQNVLAVLEISKDKAIEKVIDLARV